MANYTIGLSGLNAAQRALEVVGNNIANAATEGYHRQRVDLTTAYSSQTGSVSVGGGVNVKGVTRAVDTLLEQEIVRQKSSLKHVSTEVDMLSSVETALGELSGETGGLNILMDKFFASLTDLAAHPNDAIWQNQVLTHAQSVANQFRTLGDFLQDLQTQIKLEVENTVKTINSLSSKIAELNSNIKKIELSGGSANNLKDQRDQTIVELSELAGVRTQARDHGVVDVTVAGLPLVMGMFSTDLTSDFDSDGKLGISLKDAASLETNVEGGRIGGLLSLANNLISKADADLDKLASAVISKVNQYHVQGVGPAGSFTTLTGSIMSGSDMSAYKPPITAGEFYIRVTDSATGDISRHKIAVDPASDTLATVASKIDALTGVSASAASSKLTISAQAGYKFDFVPAVLSEPTKSTLNGSSPPSIEISGIYADSANDTIKFAASGAGTVGNGTLQLSVTNGAGSTLANLSIGSGYAPGDTITLENGLKISVGAGDFAAADSFEADVFTDTDTSGLLSTVGINAFFTGSGADDIAVASVLLDDPRRIASAAGPDMTDNTVARQMAGAGSESVSTLNNQSCGDFYRRFVTDIGQNVQLKKMRSENMASMVESLSEKQAQLSGVDINDEAAQMLVFEQIFQAMSKYLATVQNSVATMMQIVGS